MRRLPALLLTIVAIVALAACSAGAAPGWTYAPAASATPVPSGAASGEPSVAPSGAASAPAAGSPVPSATAQPLPSGSAAAGLTVTATTTSATSGWDPATLETAAGAAFSLTFDNQDNTVPHDLIVQNPDGSAVAVQGDVAPFTGPGQRVLQVPALTAGAYKYICQVHPATMVGTLTVK
jgi:plastocyanin